MTSGCQALARPLPQVPERPGQDMAGMQDSKGLRGSKMLMYSIAVSCILSRAISSCHHLDSLVILNT